MNNVFWIKEWKDNQEPMKDEWMNKWMNAPIMIGGC